MIFLQDYSPAFRGRFEDRPCPSTDKLAFVDRTSVKAVLLRSCGAFDPGHTTVTSDYRVEVSRRIHQDFDHSKEYYRLHGKHLKALPQQQFEQPDPEFIEWHNEYRYVG